MLTELDDSQNSLYRLVAPHGISFLCAVTSLLERKENVFQEVITKGPPTFLVSFFEVHRCVRHRQSESHNVETI